MGAKRSHSKKKWPKDVYTSKGRIVWKEYLGKVDGRYLRAKEIVLCKAPATDAQIWENYLRVTDQATDTLAWLLSMYHDSTQFQGLMPKTQTDYEGYQVKLLSYPVVRGRKFGDMPYAKIKRTTIRGYLDNYTKKNGDRAPVAANRHIQYLKSAFNWARERYDAVRDNPCEKVKLNKEEARTRYVNDEEYTAAITIAMASGSPYIAAFMELAVLCRARRSEIACLTDKDIQQDGLRLRRGKGSEGEITTWTKRLEGAVNYAKSLHKNAITPISGAYLIHNKRGQPITESSFKSAWRRLMDKIEAQGGEHFTFHDLKAKGYSDMKGEQFAGHKSPLMHKVYNRKLRKIGATE